MKAPRAAFDDEEVALGSREDCAALALRGDCEAIAAAGKAGIALDGYDEEGYSPAHYAAANGNCAALRALAAAGVDLNLPGSRAGASVASAAAGRGRCDAIATLSALGVDLGRRGWDGWTAAGAAALNGRADALRALAAAGVDLDEPCNSKGEAPATVARKLGHASAAAAAATMTADAKPSTRALDDAAAHGAGGASNRAAPTRRKAGEAGPSGQIPANPEDQRQSDSDSDDD